MTQSLPSTPLHESVAVQLPPVSRIAAAPNFLPAADTRSNLPPQNPRPSHRPSPPSDVPAAPAPSFRPAAAACTQSFDSAPAPTPAPDQFFHPAARQTDAALPPPPV